MDSDSFSPFSQVFKEEHLVVAREGTYTEASFYMVFSPVTASMRLNVYDPENPGKFKLEGGDSELENKVDPLIAEIEAFYGVTVPPVFSKLSHAYLANASSILSVEGEIGVEAEDPDEDFDDYANDDTDADETDADSAYEYDSSYCETCGDYNSNSIEAFYFPAIPGIVSEASLAVHIELGCYYSVTYSGDLGNAKNKVLEVMKKHEELEDRGTETQVQLQEFIDAVEKL
jgi:hypothetical protein